MEPIYVQNVTIDDSYADRFGRMKPSMILYIVQEAGGQHSALMALDYDTLASRRMFWAVTRHRVQITRLPQRGETIRVETWPLPATRATFPRSVVAYDAEGNEVFRAISLWVLMDLDTRRMITPSKSGISVVGTLRGIELPSPSGLVPRPVCNTHVRTVVFNDLDRNGHMNNTRCMDWVADLLPSSFHENHTVKEFTVCYLAEALETEQLTMNWELVDGTELQVDSHCGEDDHRVFSVKLFYDQNAL